MHLLNHEDLAIKSPATSRTIAALTGIAVALPPVDGAAEDGISSTIMVGPAVVEVTGILPAPAADLLMTAVLCLAEAGDLIAEFPTVRDYAMRHRDRPAHARAHEIHTRGPRELAA